MPLDRSNAAKKGWETRRKGGKGGTGTGAAGGIRLGSGQVRQSIGKDPSNKGAPANAKARPNPMAYGSSQKDRKGAAINGNNNINGAARGTKAKSPKPIPKGAGGAADREVGRGMFKVRVDGGAAVGGAKVWEDRAYSVGGVRDGARNASWSSRQDKSKVRSQYNQLPPAKGGTGKYTPGAPSGKAKGGVKSGSAMTKPTRLRDKVKAKIKGWFGK